MLFLCARIDFTVMARAKKVILHENNIQNERNRAERKRHFQMAEADTIFSYESITAWRIWASETDESEKNYKMKMKNVNA